MSVVKIEVLGGPPPTFSITTQERPVSLATVPVIMERIRAATPKSPIAVFYSARGDDNRLKAVFADTVLTVQALRREKHNLIGVYHQDMEPGLIQAGLFSALKMNAVPW